MVVVVAEGTELEILERSGKYMKVTVWHPEQGSIIGFVASHMIGLPISPDSVSSAQGGTLKCPTCGAESWERMGVTAGNPVGPRIHSVFLDTGFFGGFQLEAKVCLECGFVQLGLDRDDLESLRVSKR